MRASPTHTHRHKHVHIKPKLVARTTLNIAIKDTDGSLMLLLLIG